MNQLPLTDMTMVGWLKWVVVIKKEDWATSKTLCNTEEELIALIKEYNSMDLDN
jgi:hypothetical protein